MMYNGLYNSGKINFVLPVIELFVFQTYNYHAVTWKRTIAIELLSGPI